MPTWLSLSVIFGVLAVTVIASIVADRRDPEAPLLEPEEPVAQP
jgi:hypothetical protein